MTRFLPGVHTRHSYDPNGFHAPPLMSQNTFPKHTVSSEACKLLSGGREPTFPACLPLIRHCTHNPHEKHAHFMAQSSGSVQQGSLTCLKLDRGRTGLI